MREPDLFDGTRDKVAIAIDRLKFYEPKDQPYWLAFSGGKDSQCIYELAKMAGVKFRAVYSVTTIDPPDLIYFIREHYPSVEFLRPDKAMLSMIATRGFPIRMGRWCCEAYKERGGDGYLVITGVRWAESARRKAGHGLISTCYKRPDKKLLNPIIDWTDDEVWEFIRERGLPYCKLYDEGWTRIGCIACPMSTPFNRAREIARYPGIERAYRRAFRRLYAHRIEQGNESVQRWPDGDAMFDWWLGNDPAPCDDDPGLFD